MSEEVPGARDWLAEGIIGPRVDDECAKLKLENDRLRDCLSQLEKELAFLRQALQSWKDAVERKDRKIAQLQQTIIRTHDTLQASLPHKRRT